MAIKVDAETLLADLASMESTHPFTLYCEETINAMVRGQAPCSADCTNMLNAIAQQRLQPTAKSDSVGKVIQRLARQAVANPVFAPQPYVQFNQNLGEIALACSGVIDCLPLNSKAFLLKKLAAFSSGLKVPHNRVTHTHIAAPTQQNTLESVCASCGKAGSRTCGGCARAPLESRSTVYCSTDCQKGHWRLHNAVCKRLQERTALYRAGETAQAPFYIWRERSFDAEVKTVEERNGILYVLEDTEEMAKNHSFPVRQLSLPEGVPESSKQAILAAQACEFPVDHLYSILKLFIKGNWSDPMNPSDHAKLKTESIDICQDIREVSVKIMNADRPVAITDQADGRPQNDMYRKHSLLNVKTNSGEPYVVDITCAQYGWKSPTMPVEDFAEKHLFSKGKDLPFGIAYVENVRLVTGVGSNQTLKLLHSIFGMLLFGIVKEWMGAEKLDAMKMLKAPSATFLQQKAALLSFAKSSFCDRTDRIEAREQYYYCYDKGTKIIRQVFRSVAEEEEHFAMLKALIREIPGA